MSQIWFTGDEHIGHANIIKLCKRPFVHNDEMTEALIIRHNSRVSADDTVYHLGDMFWKSFKSPFSVMGRLNGKHHYILGNHEDAFAIHPTLSESFMTFSENCEISAEITVGTVRRNHLIFMSHYSHRTWPGSSHGSWHLFGHSHGSLPPYGLSFDVGVDAWDYYPVSLDEVAAKMAQLKQFEAVR